jgi:probable phosphoglycerate mutase
MSSTVIDLLRHGEPEGGRAFRGNSVDDPLSDTGWQQMRSAIAEDMLWQKIVTSPMKRCREFSEEIAQSRQLPLQVEPDLREVGFGAWEGRTPEQIKIETPGEYEAFYLDPVNNRPAGAEPLSDFYDRVVRSFERIREEHQGQQLLLVTHAGVIRALMTYVMQAPISSMYRLRIGYAGFCRIRLDRENVKLERINA